MPTHEKFEELCALAVSGELREEELADLNEHLQGCPECKVLWAAFEETYFKLSAAEYEDTRPIPEGMTQRFIARARSAGISLPPQPSSLSEPGMLERVSIGTRSKSIAFWAPIVVLVLTVASFFLGMRYQRARHVSGPSRLSTSQGPASETSQRINEDLRLKEQLRQAQSQLATASTKLEQQREALESGKQEKASLVLQIAELKASSAVLRENEAKRNTKIDELEAELEKTRTKENADHAAALVTETELNNLRDRVTKLSLQLRLAQQLDATLREAHDLIVDRHVHVLNVFPEVGEGSRSSQARGRIFYSEGKKLVFYAYDLTDAANINANPSFYLWGQTPGTVQKIVSLGKFQVDSEQEGRWVLTVTDPALLAHINSAFVTEEPYKKAVLQPSGRRMLFRVLDKGASEQ